MESEAASFSTLKRQLVVDLQKSSNRYKIDLFNLRATMKSFTCLMQFKICHTVTTHSEEDGERAQRSQLILHYNKLLGSIARK